MPARKARTSVVGMKRAHVLLLAALGAAALASGCGGDDETPAAVGWADDVCSAVTTWTESVGSATESLASGDSESGLEAAVEDVREATRTLADDLQALDAPETESGQQARASLDALAEELRQDAETIQEAAADAEGASGTLSAVSTISGTLVTMGEQASATLDGLRQLDARGELADAFDQAESCEGLGDRTP